MKRFLRRFAGFFTGILVAFAVFFNFSCTLQNIEETKSSVGFNLQSNFLRSLARNANDETGKIVLKAEISSQDVTPPSTFQKNGQFYSQK